MWVLTLAAAAVRMAWPTAPEPAGRCIGRAARRPRAAMGVDPAAPHPACSAGGLLYIAGALSYHRRWPDPYPSLFGYHEVFHVYVCAAAACQYAAIARLIG